MFDVQKDPFWIAQLSRAGVFGRKQDLHWQYGEHPNPPISVVIVVVINGKMNEWKREGEKTQTTFLPSRNNSISTWCVASKSHRVEWRESISTITFALTGTSSSTITLFITNREIVSTHCEWGMKCVNLKKKNTNPLFWLTRCTTDICRNIWNPMLSTST